MHRRYGWSWSGFRILYMLWLFDRAVARDLARLAGVSRQTTSSVLATLEAKGLVQRERGTSKDRRLAPVSLTRTGRALLEEALAEQNRAELEWFGCLSEQERRTLQELLERVTARMLSNRDPGGRDLAVPGRDGGASDQDV